APYAGAFVAQASRPARGEVHAAKNFLQKDAKTFRRRPLPFALTARAPVPFAAKGSDER
ncbi:hypothetical protein SAMN03159353_10847, partial [Cedecea sp. NFIX57]